MSAPSGNVSPLNLPRGTAVTTATIERRTEAICPPWCLGHQGNYQGWETLCEGGGQVRDHSEHGTYVSNVNVMLVQSEHEDHTLEPSVVAVYVERDCDDLTPAQARELAAALVSAAERAEVRG